MFPGPSEPASTMRGLSILLLLLLLCPAARANPVHPAWGVLLEQQQAWNRGDLETFLKAYLESEDLIFTSGGKITQGYEAIRKRYLDRYGSNKETMGQLGFEAVKIEPLGDLHLLLIGKWQLEWPDQPDKPGMGGIFSLVMVKTDSGWKILHDHTSALAP
ncbi:nuclear transport factor 2 family protein [bacterium CPR1]|nr:nuclear transport factor 2 family protein [bacterium CPR1]